MICRCDRAGHFARDCPEEEERAVGLTGRDRMISDPRARQYGRGGGLKCYKCSRSEKFVIENKPRMS